MAGGLQFVPIVQLLHEASKVNKELNNIAFIQQGQLISAPAKSCDCFRVLPKHEGPHNANTNVCEIHSTLLFLAFPFTVLTSYLALDLRYAALTRCWTSDLPFFALIFCSPLLPSLFLASCTLSLLYREDDSSVAALKLVFSH